MLRNRQPEENWDDDFDFANSPRNSPIPNTAPIHRHIQQTATAAITAARNRSISDLHTRDNSSHLNRHPSHHNVKSTSASAARRPASPPRVGGSGHGKARWSNGTGSEEDWDLELERDNVPTTSHPPTAFPASAHPSAAAPRSSLDQENPAIIFNHRRSPSPSGNTSPTMSAFSIPLSAESSLRLHPVHSRGGSSTNFLLHSGRRSVLEMEKGRQDKERRRLRKKSRPTPGIIVGDDDYDDDDGGIGLSTIPRRYALPARANDGDDSSAIGDSDDERPGLSQLEEEQHSPITQAPEPPARRPYRPHLGPHTVLPRPAAQNVPSTSAVPATSSRTAPNRKADGSSNAPHTPAKLVRKLPSPQAAPKPLQPSSSSKPRQAANAKSPSQPPSTLPVSGNSHPHPSAHTPARAHSPLPHHVTHPPPRTNSPIPTHVNDAHLADCGSSIASSHKGHKPFLSRLGSLKKWGSRHSPLLGSSKLPIGGHSQSTHAFPTLGSTTAVNEMGAAEPSTSSHHGPRRSYGLLGRKPSKTLKESRDEPEGEDAAKEIKKSSNPFRRISISAVKRTISGGDSVDASQANPTGAHPNASKSQLALEEGKERKAATSGSSNPGHSRTFSFSTLGRSKLLGGKFAKDAEEGEHSTIGNIHGPHTVGRSAAMAKAPKPPLKLSVLSRPDNHNPSLSSLSVDSLGPPASNTRSHTSSRIPSPIPGSATTQSSSSAAPFVERRPQPKPLLPAFDPTGKSKSSSSSSANHSHGSVSKSNQGSMRRDESTPKARKPFPTDARAGSKHTQIQVGGSGSHTREETVKHTSSSGYHSSSSRSKSNAESTPKALNSRLLPPSPEVTPMPATVSRVTGHGMVVEKKEGPRRSSVGEAQRHATSSSSGRRGGELKIPARISAMQGNIKREMEAVKDFALSIEDLKRLQSAYQVSLSKATQTVTSSTRHSSRTPSPVEKISQQYAIWWECAELLIELGGAAPPTVAGTPIKEAPSANSSPFKPSHGPGTHPSFSSTSSGGDLSTRQLMLLKQMLATPDPRSFSPPPSIPESSSRVTLGSESERGGRDVFASLRWGKGQSGNVSSSSGTDHVSTDPSSGRSKSHSIDSGDSSHPALSISRAHQYVGAGAYNRNNAATSSRPSITGMFGKADIPKSSSRGGLTDEGSSSAAGRHTTDDEDISDWDAESDHGNNNSNTIAEGVVYNGSRPSMHRYPSHATSASTTSSSLDIHSRMSLTPENIAPLLAYSKEVRGRLQECLLVLSQLDKRTTNDNPPQSRSQQHAPPQSHSHSSQRDNHANPNTRGSVSRSSGRHVKTLTIGTSSHRG